MLKFSIEELNKNDVIKTAGILQKLKNKLLTLFEPYRREKVEMMLDNTAELKPVLSQAYNAIKSIEDSINSYDVIGYESKIDELRNLLVQLNDMLKETEEIASANQEELLKTKTEPKIEPKIEKPISPSDKYKFLMNAPRERIKFSEYSQKYYRENGSLYENLNEFGKQFGVNIKFGVNILPNKVGIKALFSSWARIVFVGRILKKENTGNIEPLEESPKEFAVLQDRLTDQQMIDAFYNNLPYYKIKKIEPREKSWRTGNQTTKVGEVEVFLETGWITLPAPANEWQLKAMFVIVDKGFPDKPGNFIIYRQWIIGANKK